MLDVRSMANKIDKFKEDTVTAQKKRLKLIKNQTIEDEIDIPGLTDEKGRSIKNDE